MADPYATVEFFQLQLGPNRAAGMSHAGPTEQGVHYLTLLNAASARMNSYFEHGGYAVPIDPATAVPASLQQQLADDLAVMCASLAAWQFLPGIVDAPEGLEKAVEGILARLEAIADGKATLLGLTKSALAVQAKRAGLIAHVGSGEENLARATFTTWGQQTHLTGGF